MEKVKSAVIALCIAGSTPSGAQSPYMSVRAAMDLSADATKKYRLEMKICQPKKMTQGDDWFTKDTSSLDFIHLESADVSCGDFQVNGQGIEVLTGNTSFPKYNTYSFGNQVYAWEKILVFRITDETDSTDFTPKRMYLFLPVRYKSFVTHISIENIRFIEGKVFDLSASLGAYKSGSLAIKAKPDVSSAVPFNEFAAGHWIW